MSTQGQSVWTTTFAHNTQNTTSINYRCRTEQN